MKIRLDDEKDGQPFEPSEWYIDGGDMSATYQPKNIKFLIRPDKGTTKLDPLKVYAELAHQSKKVPKDVEKIGKQALAALLCLLGGLKRIQR